jgi:hypothetical protein
MRKQVSGDVPESLSLSLKETYIVYRHVEEVYATSSPNHQTEIRFIFRASSPCIVGYGTAC